MPSKSETKADAATFTVAKGRTITHTAENSPAKHYGPGESIKLSPEEGERLRTLGFLVGEDGEPVVQPEGAGPATVNGAEIKES